MNHREVRATIRQVIAEIAGARRRVHGHCNCPDAGRAEERFDEFSTVRKREQHAVPGAAASDPKCAARTASPFRQFAVGHRRPFAGNRCSLRMIGRGTLNKILSDIEGSRNAFGRHPDILLVFYLLEVVWPSLRNRSCNFRRSAAGVFGLNATRYQSGWLRSRESHASVVESALGCRATFSRIAA